MNERYTLELMYRFGRQDSALDAPRIADIGMVPYIGWYHEAYRRLFP